MPMFTDTRNNTIYEDDTQNTMTTTLKQKDDQRGLLINYFKSDTLPKDRAQRMQLKKRALRYVFVNNTLYCRSYEQVWYVIAWIMKKLVNYVRCMEI